MRTLLYSATPKGQTGMAVLLIDLHRYVRPSCLAVFLDNDDTLDVAAISGAC